MRQEEEGIGFQIWETIFFFFFFQTLGKGVKLVQEEIRDGLAH